MECNNLLNSDLYQSIADNINIDSSTIIEEDDAHSSTATINGIREYYKGDQDMYEWVNETVKQVLAEKGKFNFRAKPSRNLIIKPMLTYHNGDKYFGQFNPNTNIRCGQGIYVCAKDESLYEGYWKHNQRSGIGRLI